jgi:predicted CopG family antitoxin
VTRLYQEDLEVLNEAIWVEEEEEIEYLIVNKIK